MRQGGTGDDSCADGGRAGGLVNFFAHWLFSTNHRDVGTKYLVFAILGGIVGGALSLLMRMELAAPGLQYFADAQMFNVVVTAHGLVMVFFMVMPAMIGGFGNWFVPLQIGAPDTAFPTLSNVAFWLLPVAFVLLLVSMFVPGPAGGVGFAGAPGAVATEAMASGLAVDLAFGALLLTGISMILGAINLITTIFNMRAPGMNLHQMPLFVWSILISAFMLLVSLPVFAGAITMLLSDRNFATTFYASSGGGDVVLFQHLYWFFANPELYILILPGFGIVSHVVATFSGRPVVAYRAMVYAMVGFGLVGFIVWAQQMFGGGATIDVRAYFAFAAMAIAIPLGVAVYSWLATIVRGPVLMRLPMLWALGFIFLFSLGAVRGLLAVSSGVGSTFAGTYYVVGHFHFVLFHFVISLGAVFSIFAAWYCWFPEMSGRMYSRIWGGLHFWLTFVGVNLMLVSQIFQVGPVLERSRVDSAVTDTLGTIVASAGAYVAILGTVCFLVGLVVALRGERTVKESPWNGAHAAATSNGLVR